MSLSQLSSDFKSIGAPFLMLRPDVLGVGSVKLDGTFELFTVWDFVTFDFLVFVCFDFWVFVLFSFKVLA